MDFKGKEKSLSITDQFFGGLLATRPGRIFIAGKWTQILNFDPLNERIKREG